MALGYDKHWNTTNPFDFMTQISLVPKTNFFEARVGQYQKAGVLNNDNSTVLTFSEDF